VASVLATAFKCLTNLFKASTGDLLSRLGSRDCVNQNLRRDLAVERTRECEVSGLLGLMFSP